MSNVKKELNEFTKEELIELVEKKERELKVTNDCYLHLIKERDKLLKKLETLKNIIEL
ncbi:MAG: hypothetical protein IKV17_07615 [Bacteroidaceae bacterium]|nr:hypothetical protein [Bacteroidaceae bacterium]